MLDESPELVQETTLRIEQIVAETSLEEKRDDDLFNEKLRKDLKKLFRKKTGKRPLILSMTLEI